MKRLYFLTQQIESADSISNDLHDAGITDWNFHVLSKHEKGLYKRHIHLANLLQKTDFIHSAERGVLKGIVGGLATALVLSQIPIHGSTPSFSLLLGVLVFGVIVGGWHGSLLGYQNENYQLKPFHEKIEQGYFLIMVDVSASQASLVIKLMQKKHPESTYCRKGSTLTLPFGRVSVATF